MREIVLWNMGDGYQYRAMREDGTVFAPDQIPDEISESVKLIIDYAEGQKTGKEKAAAEAAKYIAETAPIEKQLELIDVFPIWSEGIVVQEGEQYQYKGMLYKALQAHKALDGWTPDKVPNMFLCLSPVAEAGKVQPWRQPTGAHDAYAKGDQMRYVDGKIYESVIAANTYTPEAYPPGWKEVKG